MAAAVLLGGIELGGGAPEVGNQEQRVVAEAVLSPGRLDDRPAPESLGDHGHRILRVAQEDHHAHERGAALVGRHPLELGEEPRVVRRVVARPTCVARRTDPRRAAQRVDGEPRVVRDRREPGRGCRVARLDQCILDESRRVLHGFGHIPGRLRPQFISQRFQNRRQLGQFPFVTAGQHDGSPTRPDRPARRVPGFVHGFSAAVWTAISSRMPFSARSSMASSSPRRNA